MKVFYLVATSLIMVAGVFAKGKDTSKINQIKFDYSTGKLQLSNVKKHLKVGDLFSVVVENIPDSVSIVYQVDFANKNLEGMENFESTISGKTGNAETRTTDTGSQEADKKEIAQNEEEELTKALKSQSSSYFKGEIQKLVVESNIDLSTAPKLSERLSNVDFGKAAYSKLKVEPNDQEMSDQTQTTVKKNG